RLRLILGVAVMVFDRDPVPRLAVGIVIEPAAWPGRRNVREYVPRHAGPSALSRIPAGGSREHQDHSRTDALTRDGFPAGALLIPQPCPLLAEEVPKLPEANGTSLLRYECGALEFVWTPPTIPVSPEDGDIGLR